MAGATAAVELQVLIKVLQDQSNSFKSLLEGARTAFSGVKTEATSSLDAFNKFFGSATKSAKDFGDESEKAFKKPKDATEDLSKSLEKLARFAKLAAGGFLAFESVRFIKDIADTAARSQVLSTVLHVVGNNAGYMTEQLDGLDKQVQKLGITASASRQALTQMIQAGLDPGLAAGPQGLARAAQDLAVIGGINSSEAFSRMISAIQRMDTQSLRSLGIMVSNERAQQKYADSINKTVGQLTQQQKVQATANAVMEEATKLAGTYEQAQGDVGKMLTSLPRYTENLATAVGSQLLPAYRALIEEWTTFLKQMTAIADGNTDLGDALSGLVGIIHTLGGALREVAIFLAEHADVVIKIVEAYLLWKATVSTLTFLTNLPRYLAAIIDGFTGWVRAVKELVTWLELLGSAKQAKAYSDLTAGLTAAGAAAKTTASGFLEAGAAATTATAAVEGLTLSWAAASALFAIPVVIGGFLISRAMKQADEDRKKDPIKLALEASDENTTALLGDPQARIRAAFDEWVKKNPAKVKALGGLTTGDEPQFLGDSGLVAPLNREAPVSRAFLDEVDQARRDRAADIKAQTLSDREAAVEKAKSELQALKLKAAQQGGTSLDADIDRKSREIERLQRQATSAKEEIDADDKRAKSLIYRDQEVEAIAKVAKAEADLNAVKEKTYKNDEDRVKATKKAQDDLAAATKEKKSVTELREAATVQEGMSPQQREEQRLIVEQKGKEAAANRLANEQLEARRKLLGDKNIIKGEVVSDKAFEQLGNLNQLVEGLKRLQESGGDTTEQMVLLREGIKNTQELMRTPADLRAYIKSLDDLAAAAKTAGTYDAATRTAIARAKQEAGLTVTAAREGETPRTRAAAKAKFEATSGELKDRLEFEQQQLQLAHQKEEQIDKEDLDQKLITQDEYFDARILRIKEATELEVRQAEANTAAAAERLRRATSEEKPGAERSLKAAQEQEVTVAAKGQSQIDAENAKRREFSTSAQRQTIQLTLETAGYYGGLAERIAIINHQYDEQLRTTKAVGDQEKAINEQREKDIYAATLADQNKKLQQQEQLQEAVLSQEEARITAAKSSGDLTTAQAQQETNAVIRERLALNAQLIAIQEVLLKQAIANRDAAIAAGKPYEKFQDDVLAAYERLSQLHTQAVQLATSIETYGKKLKEAFGEGLANALTEIGMGGKNIQDAFKSFQEGMRRQVIGAYTKNISERVTTALGNIGTKEVQDPNDPTKKIRTGGGLFDAPFRLLGLGKPPNAHDGSAKDKMLYTEVTNLPKTPTVTTEEKGRTAEGPLGEVAAYDEQGNPILPSGGVRPQSLNPDEFKAPNIDSIQQTVEQNTNAQVAAYANIFGTLAKGIMKIVNLFKFKPGQLGDVGSTATVPELAEGGVIEGPGTGTSDSIAALLSTGEHIMPAAKTAVWGPLLEGIRLGRYDGLVNGGGFAYAGGNVQSIAIPPLIPRRYAGGGIVVSDGGASAVTPGGGGPGQMQVTLHPEAMNMTMRDWLELEVARQQTRR